MQNVTTGGKINKYFKLIEQKISDITYFLQTFLANLLFGDDNEEKLDQAAVHKNQQLSNKMENNINFDEINNIDGKNKMNGKNLHERLNVIDYYVETNEVVNFKQQLQQSKDKSSVYYWISLL